MRRPVVSYSLALAIMAAPAIAGAVNFTGLIGTIYTEPGGEYFGFTFQANLPANIVANCPTANGYVMARVPSSHYISTVLTARALGRPVTVVFAGCENSGAWHKPSAVYLEL